MSNVIQFLQNLGGNPAITRFSANEYAASVALLDVDEAQREALLSRDQAWLTDLLDGRNKMFFVVYAPDEQQDEGDEPTREPSPEGIPPEAE